MCWFGHAFALRGVLGFLVFELGMCPSLGDATHLFYAFGYVLVLRSVLGFLGVGFWVCVCACCFFGMVAHCM